MDAFFFAKHDDDERLRQLRGFLKDYEQRVNPDTLPLMLRSYNDWTNSNRVVWPYPGSRISQPAWVLDLFSIFESVDEVRKLEAKRPNVQGLPSIEDVFGDMAK